jgi:hypothetical protein
MLLIPFRGGDFQGGQRLPDAVLLDSTKATGSGQPFIANGAGFMAHRINGVLA